MAEQTCGPDVTSWFRKEIDIFQEAAQAGYSRSIVLGSIVLGPFAGWYVYSLVVMYDLALKADYKCRKTADVFTPHTPFTPNPGCPNAVKDTVNLCGKCITTNQLGNIIYGVIAFELGLISEATDFGYKGPADWANHPEKETAFKIGVELARWRYNNPNLKPDICHVIGHRFGGPPIDKGTDRLPPCKDGRGNLVIYNGPNTGEIKLPDTDIIGRVPK